MPQTPPSIVAISSEGISVASLQVGVWRASRMTAALEMIEISSSRKTGCFGGYGIIPC